MTEKEMIERIAFQVADAMFTAAFHEKQNHPQLAKRIRIRVTGMLDVAKALELKTNDVTSRAYEIYQEQLKSR